MTFKANLEKYADITVKVGLNIQPGQTLWINAPIHTPELVRLITKKSYEAGAKHVFVEWQDDVITQLKYKMAPDEAFEEYPMWRAKALEDIAEQDGAYLYIDSSDPELLKEVDGKRLSAFSKAAGAALVKWREAMNTYKMTWSIIAVPSVAWAKKVFPDLADQDAIDALWNAIFEATRVNQDEPIQKWLDHNATLREKREYLNQKQYKKIHYRAPGTELTVELPDKHLWKGGATNTLQGNPTNPNLPTEEVFVSPRREGTQGVVRSTKPLSYQGNLIEEFTLKFENGRIVEYQAEKGYETLKNLVELDEGAHYLGEIALVPHDSPISNSNLIFFNTLFDENASNHLAIGRAFATCIEGGTTMTKEELAQAGLNDSITHVDFMIGSGQMDIDGELADGTREPIFRNGNWAF